MSDINERKTGDLKADYDLVCLSHLRWDFVYQRPQHLMSRFAKERRVFFFEEPIFSDEETRLDVSPREDNLYVVVPRVSHADRDSRNPTDLQREMLDELFSTENIKDFVLWFYTPMAMSFAEQTAPLAVVYDCMDELAAFKFAPPELIDNEKKLFKQADLVFTGGQSLYEAKQNQHERVFAFPSSIDTKHFGQARQNPAEPTDQASVKHPKLGFIGVIDERMDIEMLSEMAGMRPEWQFVMIGPVVKIAPEDLPHGENIHYLGGKDYKELPAYIAAWDAALMPFAMNESTKFISPTKTPEYLAAGKPVVSTPIRDVVRPYGDLGLVQIASTAEEFVAAIEKALAEDFTKSLPEVDKFLSQNSWDKTWSRMADLIAEAVNENKIAARDSKTATAN